VFALCLIAACGSPDYGQPTDSTSIELSQSGGFGGPSNARGVRIVGLNVTYTKGGTSTPRQIERSQVGDILHALEAVDFLDLQSDYTTCTPMTSDAETVTISVMIGVGIHSLRHSLGCMGGVFDQLQDLDRKIYNLSGYDAWAAGQ
jgi:hypothetical protein